MSDFTRLGNEQIDEIRSSYYALISQIDAGLGRLFARLHELQLLENTWIIFTADHGEMLDDHHLGSKLVHFEGSAHIPMIVRPPAPAWPVPETAGTQCDRLVSLADIMPTCLSIAGIAAPEDLDGQSLIDIAKAPDTQNRLHIGNCSDQY